MQADALHALPTVLVVPLDPSAAVFAGRRGAVSVPAAEAGSAVDHVAVVHHVRPVAASSLAPGVRGRLSASTLDQIDRGLKFVLGLR